MPSRSQSLVSKFPESAEREALFELWKALSAYPAAEWHGELTHLLEWIARAIDADNVIWIGAIRVLRGPEADCDPFLGWRLRGRYALHPDPEPYRRQLDAYYTKDHYGKLTPSYRQRSHESSVDAHIGMTAHASVDGAGQFRVHRLRDGWINYAQFRRTEHFRLYYQEPGIRDRIWVGFPVTAEHESFFLIDRIQRTGAPRRRGFTLAQATLAGDAIRGNPSLHRRLFLGNGLLVGEKPLTPTEQDILRGLLTGKSEKEIAQVTGQKPATLHKYVTALYARFNVKGRAALMTLWLGGQ